MGLRQLIAGLLVAASLYPGCSKEPESQAALKNNSSSPISVYFAPCKPDDRDGIDDKLAEFVSSAKQSIDAACYDIDLENVTDAIINAHKTGKKVRIVTDSDSINQQIKRLREAGVAVVEDNRKGLMHNKFCIVDSKEVWTGSFNWTANCAYKNDNNAVVVRAEGVAKNYLDEFEEMFSGVFGKGEPTKNPVVKIDDIVVESYFAPEDNVAELLEKKIRKAEKSIRFMMYRFTNNELAFAMVGRKIPVYGIIEEQQHTKGTWAIFSYAGGRKDVTVTLDSNPRMMHHKVIVFDDEIVVTGSYNLSKSAEEKNDENALVIRHRETAGKFVKEYERLSGGQEAEQSDD